MEGLLQNEVAAAAAAALGRPKDATGKDQGAYRVTKTKFPIEVKKR